MTFGIRTGNLFTVPSTGSLPNSSPVQKHNSNVRETSIDGQPPPNSDHRKAGDRRMRSLVEATTADREKKNSSENDNEQGSSSPTNFGRFQAGMASSEISAKQLAETYLLDEKCIRDISGIAFSLPDFKGSLAKPNETYQGAEIFVCCDAMLKINEEIKKIADSSPSDFQKQFQDLSEQQKNNLNKIIAYQAQDPSLKQNQKISDHVAKLRGEVKDGKQKRKEIETQNNASEGALGADQINKIFAKAASHLDWPTGEVKQPSKTVGKTLKLSTGNGAIGGAIAGHNLRLKQGNFNAGNKALDVSGVPKTHSCDLGKVGKPANPQAKTFDEGNRGASIKKLVDTYKLDFHILEAAQKQAPWVLKEEFKNLININQSLDTIASDCPDDFLTQCEVLHGEQKRCLSEVYRITPVDNREMHIHIGSLKQAAKDGATARESTRDAISEGVAKRKTMEVLANSSEAKPTETNETVQPATSTEELIQTYILSSEVFKEAEKILNKLPDDKLPEAGLKALLKDACNKLKEINRLIGTSSSIVHNPESKFEYSPSLIRQVCKYDHNCQMDILHGIRKLEGDTPVISNLFLKEMEEGEKERERMNILVKGSGSSKSETPPAVTAKPMTLPAVKEETDPPIASTSSTVAGSDTQDANRKLDSQIKNGLDGIETLKNKEPDETLRKTYDEILNCGREIEAVLTGENPADHQQKLAELHGKMDKHIQDIEDKVGPESKGEVQEKLNELKQQNKELLQALDGQSQGEETDSPLSPPVGTPATPGTPNGNPMAPMDAQFQSMHDMMRMQNRMHVENQQMQLFQQQLQMQKNQFAMMLENMMSLMKILMKINQEGNKAAEQAFG